MTLRIATWLSLALCIASSAMWARSRWYDDYLAFGGRPGSFPILSGGGTAPPSATLEERWLLRSWDGAVELRRVLKISGMDRYYFLKPTPEFFLPYFVLVLGFAVLPTLRLLRRRPVDRGRCRHCGYDLRAKPDPSGPLLSRCPECGRDIASSGSAG